MSTSRLKGRTPLAKGASFYDEFNKDEIKRKVDIVLLMESFGIHLEKKGSSYMGLCPFHEDKNPSLSVDRTKGLFNCFGCGEGGDVFDLVMKIKGIDFPEAYKFLKGFIGKSSKTPISSVSPSRPVAEMAESEVKKESSPPIVKRESRKIISLPDVIASYRTDLETTQEAKDYLKSRGLMIPDIIKRFSIGYSAGRLIERISDEQKEDLQDEGIISRKGKEVFQGCIIFPLKDWQEQPVSLYGRQIGNRKPKHLYMSGPHKGLLNPKAYKVYQERMIWSESIIDALSLIALGFENTDALYGTNGFTEAHIQALKEARIKEIILAFDNDEAGRNASEKMSEKLQEKDVSTRCIFPPDPFKDWNEFLLEVGESGKAVIEELIVESEPTLIQRSNLHISKNNDRYIAVSRIAHNTEVTYMLIGVKYGFLSSLKVNIRAKLTMSEESPTDDPVIDNVDLFSARSRTSFADGLSRRLGIESARVEKDLIEILEYLEEANDRNGEEELKPNTPQPLTSSEKDEGLSFLKDPRLFERIEEDLEVVGYVGESVNKRLMYLAASSRKMDSPISIMVTSQSASGKSYLIDSVKKLMPPEDVVSMTSLSDQALNYMEDDALIHKFLTMGEAVHSDIVDYQIREMLSSKELSRTVTTKDEKNGRMVSITVKKKVIVALAMSTTSNDINDENASRCFLISTDETKKQTEAIHRRQRQKYSFEAYRRKEESVPEIITRHQVAQRLLEPRMIINPFAEFLDFPSSQMRTRRDHERFIDLIATVCFLRQYQKPAGEKRLNQDGEVWTYIECDIEDYRIAYEIMRAILPSTLGEMPNSAQRLYEEVKHLIEKRAREQGVSASEIWIRQREIREETGLGIDFIKKNIRILVEWEYVRVRGYQRGSTYRYSLADGTIPASGNPLPTPEDVERRIQDSKANDQLGQTGAEKELDE